MSGVQVNGGWPGAPGAVATAVGTPASGLCLGGVGLTGLPPGFLIDAAADGAACAAVLAGLGTGVGRPAPGDGDGTGDGAGDGCGDGCDGSGWAPSVGATGAAVAC